MLDLMPGSPFNDDKLSQEQIDILYQKYGLDDPFLVRYFRYLFNIVKGDFGVSYNIASNVPITDLLQTRLPTSIRLGGQAVFLGASIGLLLGLVAALKHNTIFDTIATIISVLGVSLPSYVFALALSYVFGYRMGWFPLLYASETPFISSVLPTIALSMFSMANIARFTRTEMLEVLRSDYMLLAESKGISGPKLIIRHALRNALIPIITVLGPLIVNTMTGSLVIEKIFSIPGIGELMVRSIQQNDYNVTIALSFIYSLMYIGIMLVVDILYGIIDPRIRLSKEDNHES
jgi:oligopeptide transport system permease protein